MADTQEAMTMRVKKPAFVSLVGLPANKIAFKVVRSDAAPTAPTEEPPMKPMIVQRQRRSDVHPILQLTFPAGTGEADAATRLKEFGLSGYTTVAGKDGILVARRSDLKSIATKSTADIRLVDGIVATVEREERDPDNPKSGIALVKVVFRGDVHTEDTIRDWLAARGLQVAIPAEVDGDVVLQFASAPDNEETRTIELDEGVEATIVRSTLMDGGVGSTSMPSGFVRSINEQAYGSWGWGQLDFHAAVADAEFSEAVQDGMDMLGNVLRNILLYSPLTLVERRALAVNALDQYKAYIVSTLDSLPRSVLIAATRSAPTPTKEPTMTTPTQGGPGTQAAAQAATQTAAPAAESPITRTEVAELIRAGIVAALPSAPATAPVAQVAPAPSATPTDVGITRADVTAALSEVIAPMVERLNRLEGTTVVRSDGTDPAAAPTAGQKPGKKGDVFRGADVFRGLTVGRPAN